MDLIERAMRSGSSLREEPAAQSHQASDRLIERAAEIAKSLPLVDPSVSTVAPKRTQRSVVLDLERIRAMGLLVPDARRSRIKEEYRHIKRPLLMNATGKGATVAEHANLIMVTSARPGEGKTFTACNLALSIAAERDRTVLLVDADVIKPSVAKTLGFEAGKGLVDLLIDEQLEVADVLVDTNVPSLTILPAGSTHHLSTELLASDNMRKLAMEMSRRYTDRIIVIDSPPLLVTTEASVLATLVGQIVMVVQAGRTHQSQVQEALALLDANQIIGFVLNKKRGVLGADYYGYGYGYRYGYGHNEHDRDVEEQ
ncbi:MAG: XrtA-associated tyrosine autokinase [Candidatus Competibacteraceae bacterium]|jgi:protein-tyrosine kinase